MRTYLHAVLVVLAFGSSAFSQTLPLRPKEADLSGPRFGLTVLPESIVKDVARQQHINIRPDISQFGWQFERQLYRKESNVEMVTEWIALAGGLEQGLFIPSVSWMVGLRTRDGAEFGIGPNVSPAGTALVLATGVTMKTGLVNVPLNVAVVPSRAGTRITVLSGFSLRR